MHTTYSVVFALLFGSTVLAAPTSSLDADVFLQNGQEAQALNAAFTSLNVSDSCNDGELACVENSIAHCVNATWELEACAKSLSCFALPSVREQGVVVSCTTNATALAVISASGVTGGIASNNTSTPVELPIDCNEDDESDDTDHEANGEQSSSLAASTSTFVSTSAQATRTATASVSDSETSLSATASATTIDASSGTVTVTVTFAPTATLPSETFTFDPSQASSFLSSIATQSGVSITTILPSSFPIPSASVSATVVESSSALSSATAISSQQVGVASAPSSSSTSLPAVVAGPVRTIILQGLGKPSFTVTATTSATPDSSSGYSY